MFPLLAVPDRTCAGARGLAILAITAITIGCERPKPVSTAKSPSPAKAAQVLSESSLNTIELTAEAIERLGLSVGIIEERDMPRFRTLGAEIVLPPGGIVSVAAPLPGRLELADQETPPRVGDSVAEGQTLFQLIPLLSPERSV